MPASAVAESTRGTAFAVARYRFRATFSRRWTSYLAIVSLIGLVGGLAMGSIAGARRTQSSFPIYMASTNPADLSGITSFVNPSGNAASTGYNPALQDKIAHLAHVAQIAAQSGFNLIPLGPGGVPESPAAYPASAGEIGGPDGTNGLDLDRLSVVEGRMLDVHRADEFVATAAMAAIFHFHVGEVVRFGIYTNAQTARRTFGTVALAPYRTITARLVGIVVQSGSVVEDDTDAAGNPGLIAFGPGLTKSLLSCCAYYTGVGVKVGGPRRDIALVGREIADVLPPRSSPFSTNDVASTDAKAERAIKPESVALGVFGAIAALAALIVAAQMIGRQLRLGGSEEETLRALGAGPSMLSVESLLGIVVAVVAGSLLAVGVAIALSPLAPLGPVRPVYPDPGVAFDWPVLGLGFAVLVLGLGGVATALAVGQHARRSSADIERPGNVGSTLVSAAARSGVPAPALAGLRFALEPGSGRNAVPVRSAMLGAALAVIVVVGTVTFGSSLNALVSHPALYGWNWNYELSANQGGVLPGAATSKLLNADRDVAAWSAVDFNVVRIDGEVEVPVLGEAPNGAVTPPLLSGHAVESNDQIVLGALTLHQLRKHLGQTVVVDDGSDPRAHLVIVGTATMPTIGGGIGGSGQHLEMGTGAWLSYNVIGGAYSSGYELPGAAPGPYAVLVRLRASSGSKGLASLRAIARATSTPADYGVSVLSVQRPAEIVNYKTMGSTPAILGAGLAAGAIAALGLTLVASVRRRRRDLALLKAFGFTKRQLAAAVAWQSSVSVALGTVVGVPLGIVLGRWLWDLFAGEIDAIPAPNVPVAPVALVALAALVVANVVAAVPGRIAARTPTALVLRAE